MLSEDNELEQLLAQVRATLAGCLRDTPIDQLLHANRDLLGNGKMLRARLALRVGLANGTDRDVLVKAATAVEIIHGASLLHDDVIDGGILRRGAPSFWKRHGTNGAILFGDLLVFKGLQLVAAAGRADLLHDLIELCAQVCHSEVEQELVLRGTPGTWEKCEQIARAKTGPLFAFAAAAGAAANEPGQAEALREAGFMLGTAYQLADDLLDASGNEALSGKTLGRDRERGKTTALTATRNAPGDPVAYLYALLDASAAQVAAWPLLEQAWTTFLETAITPLFRQQVAVD